MKKERKTYIDEANNLHIRSKDLYKDNELKPYKQKFREARSSEDKSTIHAILFLSLLLMLSLIGYMFWQKYDIEKNGVPVKVEVKYIAVEDSTVNGQKYRVIGEITEGELKGQNVTFYCETIDERQVLHTGKIICGKYLESKNKFSWRLKDNE